jgi:hypothetical protein
MKNGLNAKTTDPEPFLKFLREPYDEVLTSGGILAAMQVSFAVDAGAAKDFWKAVDRGGGRHAGQAGHPVTVLFDWLVEQSVRRKVRQEKQEQERHELEARAGGAGAAGARLRQDLGDCVADLRSRNRDGVREPQGFDRRGLQGLPDRLG